MAMAMAMATRGRRRRCGSPPKGSWKMVYVMEGTKKPTVASEAGSAAFAGATAGALVSLCLHPVDTVKTVLQAERGARSSLRDAVAQIVRVRGVRSLYSGLLPNLSTAMPISAIYTATYETVKRKLLPLVGSERAWMAHSLAGGCASIATSFVFTPSECIKARMQVGQFQTAPKALFHILKHEGITSLYGGWGAVLCRNIPHSMIKFFTYEQMKKYFARNGGRETPTALETLVCGGVAGSTAAFCTTPFDVVKTRIQTQALAKGVHPTVKATLLGIVREEGFFALYRGVKPRLIIYISQGAIFFASYEVLKAVATAFFLSDVMNKPGQRKFSKEKSIIV
uniref:Mitochondrial carrier protein n=1 Tax=Picocystis salinarum TaxID=88271 RepID=A0A7S3UAJ1_9CHLO